MEYSIQLNKEIGLIFVHAAGEWEREMDNLMAQQILHTVDESGLRKVLLDMRDLHFDLSMAQIFERAKTMRDARMMYGTVSSKVALVYSAQDPKLDTDMSFFETASQNRSIPYRVFKDIEEAQKWLLQP